MSNANIYASFFSRVSLPHSRLSLMPVLCLSHVCLMPVSCLSHVCLMCLSKVGNVGQLMQSFENLLKNELVVFGLIDG